MKRVLNWMLGISLLMLLFLGFLLYRAYRASQVADPHLLELNTSLYRDPVQLKEGKVTDLSVNYIFYITKKDKQVSSVVIEVLHCKKERLTYLELPLNTGISVSSKLYQKMSAIFPDMPQYFELGEVKNFFGEDRWCGYAQLILDDMLTIDSSYYTLVTGEQEDFKQYQEAVGKELTLVNTSSVKDLIQSRKSELSSNLSIKDRYKYAGYYAGITKGNLKYETVAGTAYSDSYEINQEEFANRMKQLESGE